MLDLPAWDCQVEIMISPEISTSSAEFWFLFLHQHTADLELIFKMYFSSGKYLGNLSDDKIINFNLYIHRYM